MAELKIGEHCTLPACKQLDFLPCVCRGCGQTFCKIHQTPDSHDCAHTLDQVEHDPYQGIKGYECSLPDCRGRELTEVICEKCHKNFCLKHRHQVDHDCAEYTPPAARMEGTAQHVDNILQAKQTAAFTPSPKKLRGAKARATAAQVGLMKLKMKATGDQAIPESERLFFQVCFPLGSKEKSKSLYVSRVWSVGRTVDSMASLSALLNENNISTAKKLLMFDPVEGSSFPMDVAMETLLEGGPSDPPALYNGGTVILEYVIDKSCLVDTNKYKV